MINEAEWREEAKKGRARRMRALMVKEFFQIIRDPSTSFDHCFFTIAADFFLWIWSVARSESLACGTW